MLHEFNDLPISAKNPNKETFFTFLKLIKITKKEK